MKKFLNSLPAKAVLLTMAVVAVLLFNSFKTSWVFINNTLGIGFFTSALLWVMVLNTVVLAALTAVYLYGKDTGVKSKKAYSVINTLSSLLCAGLFLFAFIYAITLLPGESKEVFLLYLKETLSKSIALIAVGFLALFFPALSCKAKKTVCTLMLMAVAIFTVNDFFPLSPYKITSSPMVIDNGEEYSVVFSVSDYGTGYIEYTFDGEDYKVFDETGGRLNCNKKIHSISVPYEHLRNNSYRIGSTRVIEQYSYGSRLGKTVTSTEYSFKYNDSDEQTYLVISDWHTMLDEAYQAINNLAADYDAVIMMGDSSPGVDFEEQVITNTVQFGGKVTKGSKPVIYTRGNHETRGAYASELPDSLGLKELYYITDIGPYSFVVLDSGEDKDDSHSEYGGMTDYNSSRKEMIEWLKGTQVKNEKVIALSHAWEISEVEEDLSLEGWEEIDRLGARLMISGHTHQCRLIGDGSEKEKEIFALHPDIIGYMDGGKNGKEYIASLMTLDSEGFTLKAVDNSGNNVFSQSFSW